MKAKKDQSILDLAIIASGSAEAAFAFALLNDISITDDPDLLADLDKSSIINKEIVAYYANNGIIPATMQTVIIANDLNNINYPTTYIKSVNITSKKRQSLIDLTIQIAGDASAAMAFAIANGMSITDDPNIGMQLALVDIVNKSVRNYYKNNGIAPATGISATSVVTGRIFGSPFGLQFA